jgi:hypothetical protein
MNDLQLVRDRNRIGVVERMWLRASAKGVIECGVVARKKVSVWSRFVYELGDLGGK